MNGFTRSEMAADIRANPRQHRHNTRKELDRCCASEAGIGLDIKLLAAHDVWSYGRTNGGRPCDQIEGPCSCGARHNIKREGILPCRRPWE